MAFGVPGECGGGGFAFLIFLILILLVLGSCCFPCGVAKA
ncbi:MAG: hypothetical protein XD78_2090 [Desulfotomaculum sp. 46_296]|nr:MAG: hypothetical protein XD78_2090 [Desulfotomaculum sp. 46_296]HAU32183.1 sporulation protein YjcZ [Desulfotomaculum sp.]